jgi:hypothetical protein
MVVSLKQSELAFIPAKAARPTASCQRARREKIVHVKVPSLTRIQ